jgi:hypothetical protein
MAQQASDYTADAMLTCETGRVGGVAAAVNTSFVHVSCQRLAFNVVSCVQWCWTLPVPLLP